MALDLPRATLERLVQWRDRALSGAEGVRLLPAHSLHMTLAFLGYSYEKDVAKIVDSAFTGLEPEEVRLSFMELVPVPRRRPRLYALGAEDMTGSLAELQREISERLERGGFYKPEKRPFWPHLTVARIKERRGQGSWRLPGLPPLPEDLRAPFSAVRLALYSSKLKAEGAQYECLNGLDLTKDKEINDGEREST